MLAPDEWSVKTILLTSKACKIARLTTTPRKAKAECERSLSGTTEQNAYPSP